MKKSEAKLYELDLIELQFLSFLTKDIIPFITKCEFKPSRAKKFYIKITYKSPSTSGFCESPKMENGEARDLYTKILKKLGWY